MGAEVRFGARDEHDPDHGENKSDGRVLTERLDPGDPGPAAMATGVRARISAELVAEDAFVPWMNPSWKTT